MSSPFHAAETCAGPEWTGALESARRRRATGVALVAVLTVGLAAAQARAQERCARSCLATVHRCTEVECGGLAGKARRACRERCRGPNGCPAAIRTLAYPVTRCRVDGSGLTGAQELQIRRRDCDPVTVVRYVTPGATPDLPAPFGLCRLFGDRRAGFGSVLAGVVQRLGVTPDGSAVVFEITDQFQLVAKIPLEPQEQGFFYVRSDGTGLRRLAPASRDPTYRIVPTTGAPDLQFQVYIPFSPSGRRFAYTDLGPGPSGEETVQIFAVDLVTGERTQVTHLPRPTQRSLPARLTGSLLFLDEHTIVFGTYAFGPEGAEFAVRTDGSGMRTLPPPPALFLSGSRVIPNFALANPTRIIVDVPLSGTPLNPSELYPGSPIHEVFHSDGKNFLQLTNFRRVDTSGQSVSADGRRANLVASADPFGTNPFENCQLFSVDFLGGGLRQLTRFGEGVHSRTGCPFLPPPGCGIRSVVEDRHTGVIVFDSSCDPFGTNPSGYQVFAIRPDGTGLRQLTHAPGFRTSADGTIEVEQPGPTAYSAPPAF